MWTRRCTGWRGCWRAGKTGCIWRAGWCGWRSRISAWRIRARWSRRSRRSRRSISWVYRKATWRLAQITIYLAIAPKSDAAYRALNEAMETVENTMAEPVPMQLRNAPTKAMKEWGYSARLPARASVRGRAEHHELPSGQFAGDKILRTHRSRGGTEDFSASSGNSRPSWGRCRAGSRRVKPLKVIA